MAVNDPTYDDNSYVESAQPAPTQGGIVGLIQQHPNISIVVGAVLVFLVGGQLLKKTSGVQGASPTDTSGVHNGIVYVPTQTTFSTYNSTGDNSGNTTTNNNPPPPATTQTAFVRVRYSNAVVHAYDVAHPGGVPIRATPGGSIVSLAPFGSAITINGGSSSGAANFAGGSLLWLPVAGGYISTFDVTGLQTTGHGSGGDASADPNAGRSLRWTGAHIVRPGETLPQIAAYHTRINRSRGMPGNVSITWQDLYSMNTETVNEANASRHIQQMGMGHAPQGPQADYFPGERLIAPNWG